MEFWEWRELLKPFENTAFMTLRGRTFYFYTTEQGIRVNGRYFESYDHFNDILRGKAFSYNEMKVLIDNPTYIFGIVSDSRIRDIIMQILIFEKYK